MQLFVQSEAEPRNFGEVSRVLHQAVKSEDEENEAQDDDAVTSTDSDDLLCVGWNGTDDPADPKK